MLGSRRSPQPQEREQRLGENPNGASSWSSHSRNRGHWFPACPGPSPDLSRPSTWVPVSKQFSQYQLLSKQWIIRAREERFLRWEAGKSLARADRGKDLLAQFPLWLDPEPHPRDQEFPLINSLSCSGCGRDRWGNPVWGHLAYKG